ncbi:MAG: ATP-binding protein [Nannocystaceae bacterium]
MGIRDLLRPPVFADEEATRVARILHTGLLLVIGVLAASLTIRLITLGAVGQWVAYPILIVIFGVDLLILRRHVALAGAIFLITVLSLGIFGAYASGGVRSPTMNFMPLALLVAAILGRRALWAGTAACVAGVVLLLVLEVLGRIPPPLAPLTLGSTVSGHITVLVLFTLCASLLIGSLRDALSQARDNERRATVSAEEAERARRTTDDVIDSMIESVIVLDERARIRSVNGAAQQLLGYTALELIGLPFDAVLIEDRTASAALLSSAMVHSERVYRTKSGESVPVRFSNAILRGEGGTIAGIVCVASDIRRAKEIERSLRQAKELAEEASEAKSRFLANMSHELRTPLNAVIGYTELLIDEADERGLQRSRGDLERIQSAGKHLLGLISDILDLSKIEAGKMELHLETFDVADMIEGVLATVRPQAEHKALALRIKVPEKLGFIHADQTKIRQILINLLGNAVKFTETGEVIFTVRQGMREGQLWIQFLVSDTGIGMSESQIQRLFQAFSQPDAKVARRFGGTGLGLALSRVFAEMMGGTIAVHSEMGRGSNFRVDLPYLDPTLISSSGTARPDLVARALGLPDVGALLPEPAPPRRRAQPGSRTKG